MTYEEQALDFLGVTKWHSKGYKGKGIKIMSDEKVTQKLHPNVVSPKGWKTKSGHGDSVMAHIELVAPEATHIAYPFDGTFSSNSYTSDCAEYIKKNNVSIFTTSSLGSINGGREKAMQDCIDAGCIFFAAAGNDNERGIHEESKSEKHLAIGGVKPRFVSQKGDDTTYDWNDLYKANYSSVGKELDYVTIAEIMGAAGTSFCAPVFAGMCGLVQQFFLEKAGRTLARAEMIQFINDNLIDTLEEGFDIYTGNGLFVLPDPDTIKISQYVSTQDGNAQDNSTQDGIDYTGFPEIRSDIEMRGIDKLHPQMQVACNKFLEECTNQGLNVLITETLRTQAEQEELYAQGRTKPGNIVTNARGYASPHCWGVAFDFCRNVKGKEYDNSDGFFEAVGEIAKTIFDNTEYDLFWGGDFKTFVDKPHIEMIKFLPNNSTKWLIETYGNPEKFMETWEEGDDMEEVSEWAKNAWEYCKDKGILDGTNPKGTVTREMLAQVIYNLYGKDG